MRNAKNEVEQLVYDNKKYIFDSSRNILTIKSLSKNFFSKNEIIKIIIYQNMKEKSDITTSYFCNTSTGIEIHFHSQSEFNV